MLKSKNEWLKQYITVIYESKEHVFRIVDTDALYQFTNTKPDALLDSQKIKTDLVASLKNKETSLNNISEKELSNKYGLELINK
ncbi:hypothetical protein ACLCDT_05935 [Leuconostoc suionicum]|uniref:hypothetical protein n=1 Tax=Leuconostoc suionicum TaxID=1511761 RepID=UPI00397638ED